VTISAAAIMRAAEMRLAAANQELLQLTARNVDLEEKVLQLQTQLDTQLARPTAERHGDPELLPQQIRQE
jgi:cell division protein FtsB